MKNKDFYRAFEEKYRGSQELIQKRLDVYIPFILALKEVNEDVKA
jgi:O-antigen chain-terminating methyltransferase